MRFISQLCVCAVLAPSVFLADVIAEEWKPIDGITARKLIGDEVTVKLKIVTGKDRLEKRGEIYLDSQEDFKSEKNFAIVINKDGAKSLKSAGIDDPAVHYVNKTLIVTGKVTVVDDVPRIEVTEAKQIEVAKD